MGGESYFFFKADMVDAPGTIADETTRAFLTSFMDAFLNVATKIVD